MVPCSYLRVFEPLDALPVSEQERWGRYVADGNGLSVGAAVQTESRIALSRLITGRRPAPSGAALVRRVGRRIHVCPLQLVERHAVALLAFRELVPEPAIDAFVSPVEAREAVRAVERLHRPPHIQESSWEVPLRWFVAFEPDERHFTNPPEGDGPRLSYLTRAAAAMERLDRVIDVLEATIEGADPLVDPLADLIDWIASFADDSILELDYGGLTRLIPDGDLVTDLSCEDLWQVIGDLERGDVGSATAGYEQVAARWQLNRMRYRTN